MENASKALIIAGAILLAIVIISLGLVVVNNSRSAIDSANMNEQEIQTFNAKFTPYESTTGIPATRVKTLIQTVIASNSANSSVSDKVVTITYGSNTGSDDSTLSTISGALVTGKSYKVSLGYTKSLVHTITITE